MQQHQSQGLPPLPSWFREFDWTDAHIRYQLSSWDYDESWADVFPFNEIFLNDLLQYCGSNGGIDFNFLKRIEIDPYSDSFVPDVKRLLIACSIWMGDQGGKDVESQVGDLDHVEAVAEALWDFWDGGAIAGMTAMLKAGVSKEFSSLVLYVKGGEPGFRLQPLLWDERRRYVLESLLQEEDLSYTPGLFAIPTFNRGGVRSRPLYTYSRYLEIAHHWAQDESWSGCGRPEIVSTALFFGENGPEPIDHEDDGKSYQPWHTKMYKF